MTWAVELGRGGLTRRLPDVRLVAGRGSRGARRARVLLGGALDPGLSALGLTHRRSDSGAGSPSSRRAQARASTIGRNFTRVSSSSVSGSLPATIPAPAWATTGIVSDLRMAAHRLGADLRAAQRDRPLAVAVRVDPADRAGVAAAVERLERGGSARSRHPSACPPTAAVGCSDATQVERRRAVGELALDVGREVPEVRQLERERLLARAQRAVCGAQRVEHALHGVAVLVEVLRAVARARRCRRRRRPRRRRAASPGQHAGRDGAARHRARASRGSRRSRPSTAKVQVSG